MGLIDLIRRFLEPGQQPTILDSPSKFDVDQKALEFFNTLRGELEIILTEPSEPIDDLLAVAAHPEAQILSLSLALEVFNWDTEQSRPLTQEELDMVVFVEREIQLRGESGEIVVHQAPNGNEFTVRDLINAVEDTERETRGSTDWLGGIDVRHCFFEGIHETKDGVWEIFWAS
jgi:hypothetical protein